MIHSWLIWCARHKRDSSPVKTHRIDPSEFHGRRKKKRKRYKSIPTIPPQKPFNTSSPAHATKCQPVFFPCSVCSLRKFLGRETLLGLSRMARQWCYLSNSAEAYMKFINIPLLGPSLRQRTEPFKTAYYMRLYYTVFFLYQTCNILPTYLFGSWLFGKLLWTSCFLSKFPSGYYFGKFCKFLGKLW